MATFYRIVYAPSFCADRIIAIRNLAAILHLVHHWMVWIQANPIVSIKQMTPTRILWDTKKFNDLPYYIGRTAVCNLLFGKSCLTTSQTDCHIYFDDELCCWSFRALQSGCLRKHVTAAVITSLRLISWVIAYALISFSICLRNLVLIGLPYFVTFDILSLLYICTTGVYARILTLSTTFFYFFNTLNHPEYPSLNLSRHHHSKLWIVFNHNPETPDDIRIA